MINKLKVALNNFYFFRYLAYKKHKYDVLKNPKKEANRTYYAFFKQNIDWDNPKNLIEKINWLQLNTDTSLWTKYADKYEVRDYIKDCGYENNLPILYGKWNNEKDVDFNRLPNSFVLKSNHASRTVLVVKDKSKIEVKQTRRLMNRWLSITYGYAGAQLHYTKIKPCIIAEELLVQSAKDNLISPNSIIDYKFYCINGEPEAILVCFDRDDKREYITMYDVNWEKCSENIVSSDKYTYSDKDIPKPSCFQEMLEMARKLSTPFVQVRVDFYVINNKPIVGELTFATGFAWLTLEFYEYLGNKIDLSKVKQLF